MLTYLDFQEHLRDLLAHLYDPVAVENHPLTDFLVTDAEGSRADRLRRLLAEAIERLRPAESVPDDSPAWRPYRILRRRYLDGLGPQETAAELAISERQLRRDQARALDVLARFLWEQIADSLPSVPVSQPEQLEVRELCESVLQTLQERLTRAGVRLRLDLPEAPLSFFADRTLLRHLLITLLSDALEVTVNGEIRLKVENFANGLRFVVSTQCPPDATIPEPPLALQQSSLPEVSWNVAQNAGILRLTLTMPAVNAPVILVVDDQPPAVRMFQRYLSQTAFKVVGVNDPLQVFAAVTQWRPVAIVLDVMMPRRDGWELLQELKTSAQTRALPVIVCSAWDEPELALSLGAAAFLKKPVTQADFLAALRQVGLF